MRVLLSGGGTGGHVMPQLALVEYARTEADSEQTVDLIFYYIGSRRAIESRVVPQAGIRYFSIVTAKLRRYFSLANVIMPFLLLIGFVQSLWLIVRIRPRVIFSTGGYVALPVVMAGWVLRKQIIIHEQTTQSGLANRLSARVASKVLLSYPSSSGDFPDQNTIITGNPVRPSVLAGDHERALSLFDFDPVWPVVIVLGGAQGSAFINEVISSNISQLLGQTQLVWVTGTGDKFEQAQAVYRSLSTELKKRLRIFDYLGGELADIYALADLIVARSGAGTIAEIIALQKPSVLIPYLQSAGGEQQTNAQLLADVEGAVIVEQREGAGSEIVQAILDLITDEPARLRLSHALAKLAKPDAARRVLEHIIDLGNK